MAAPRETEAEVFPCEVRSPLWRRLTRGQRLALGWVTVTVFSSLFYLVAAAAASVPVLYALGRPRASVGVVGVLVVLGVIPTREWPAFRQFGQLWYEMFEMRHNVSQERMDRFAEAAETDRFILGMHPHGIVPLQAVLWCAYCDQYLRVGPDRSGPTLYGFGGMASVVLWVPVLRTILAWLAGGPADYATLKAGLEAGKNLYMLPGGLAEIFTARRDRHVVVWRRRRGLCRLALETGARLVPLYVFGGEAFFDQLLTSDSALARLSRKLQVSFTLFWGQAFLPIPFRPPSGVLLAIADPLPSVRAARGPPTPAEIDDLHAKYERALLDLFDRYKAAAGQPDATLEVR